MMLYAILAISSGGRRRASLSGTSEPSTRNIGGRPALRWMSEAPPRSATCRISLSPIVPPPSKGGKTIAAASEGPKVTGAGGSAGRGGEVGGPHTEAHRQ